jgi:NitT/TauT family transport system substrate-binding protein
MMNEINKLIWPNPSGIGVMNSDDYQRTAHIALQFKVISKAPTAQAYTKRFAMAAVAQLKKEGVDVYGKNWKAPTVAISPGGK